MILRTEFAFTLSLKVLTPHIIQIQKGFMSQVDIAIKDYPTRPIFLTSKIG